MFGKISLGKVGLVVGGILTVVGFYAYATDNATLNLVGFFYGIPVLLGGLALTASELEPVPFSQPTPPPVLALRKQQATSTQTQVLKDVTRYRYGQKAHLDLVLERLGFSPTDEERPILTSLKETETAGAYTLTLQFDSPLIPFSTWEEKREKLEKFFGPGLRVELHQSSDDLIDLTMIASTNP
jgi:Protein of unknown function (DUF2854)